VVHTLQPSTGSAASSLTVGAVDSPAEQEAEAVATRLTAQRYAPNDKPVTPVAASAGSTANRLIRRFGRGEHQEIGNATHATIDLGGGLVLTWGDIVGLAGDEFGSVEDLRTAASTQEGRDKLRQMLTNESIHSPQYVDLAMRNVMHFAGGGTAVSTWESHHESAMLSALLAGLHDNEAGWQDAQLTEAFGQHFLTDSFSAGHIRTPRAEIIAWYQNDFAPRALAPFIAQMRQRIKTELVRQIGPQMVAPNVVIEAAIDALMGGALAWFADEIRDKFQPLFGLGISGAISGALHDRDNERGLWVTSEAHPDPWMAYGDGRLKCSPVSADQAELAVITAREQLVGARALGRIRREQNGVTPATPERPGGVPTVIHFALDSVTIDAASAAALDRAADYLVAHSEQVVDIVGHTCPLGADNYNDGLGMRRAESVAAHLMNRGIAPHRLHSASAGERQPLTADVAGYASNRRAQLSYRASAEAPADLVWAQQVLTERFPGPPYQTIERFLPHEVPGRNDPQEDWHWGTLTSQMASEVDHWISHYVSGYRATVASDARLNDLVVPVPDIGTGSGGTPRFVTVQPRQPVLDILDELIAHPTDFVGRLVGIPAANRSVTPLPPPVECKPPPPP
jgi:outer membrane protein OmpA-like peptidoglycan-associated protein